MVFMNPDPIHFPVLFSFRILSQILQRPLSDQGLKLNTSLMHTDVPNKNKGIYFGYEAIRKTQILN